MPTIITSIAGIIVAIWEFFGRKATIAIATTSAFVLMVAAFLVCIKLLIVKAVALLVVPAVVQTAFFYFVPSNWTFLISLIMSAQTCKMAFNYALYKLRMINDAH